MLEKCLYVTINENLPYTYIKLWLGVVVCVRCKLFLLEGRRIFSPNAHILRFVMNQKCAILLSFCTSRDVLPLAVISSTPLASASLQYYFARQSEWTTLNFLCSYLCPLYTASLTPSSQCSDCLLYTSARSGL